MSSHNPPAPRDGYAPVNGTELYFRDIGQGHPIVLIHGGPDFDHTYFLPDMDRLSDAYRLIYYDQRGRGLSDGEVNLDEISLKQEVEDLEGLRKYLQLDKVAVLGHSWGGLMAMAYAIHHPDPVSHLILMNSAPASGEAYRQVRQEISKRQAPYADKMKELKSSAKWQAGDKATVTAYYRIHFSVAIKRPEDLDRLDITFPNFTDEGVVRAQAIEQRLYDGSVHVEGFSLLPQLKQLSIPTLIVHGDCDFVPVETVMPIVETIPVARLVVLKDCGHFAYLEAPQDVREAIRQFLNPCSDRAIG